MKGPHKTCRISLKEAEIDMLMVPAVRWLNSFQDVFTLYCCEGDFKGGQPPYILFMCTNTLAIREIIRWFKRGPYTDWATIEVDLEPFTTALRYRIHWEDKETFIFWLQNLANKQGKNDEREVPAQ